MVRRAEDYPYSSARYYAKGKRDFLIIENLYYKDMGSNALERQMNYRRFLQLEEPYAELINDQLMKY